MPFWRFTGPDPSLAPEMSGTYDTVLVILSVAVACLAGFAALSVVDRIRAAKTPRVKRGWLAVGAVAMGTGIWAMHFTAMTAFSMAMPVAYEVDLTIVSMIPAILGSGAALYFMSQPSIGWRRLQIAGLLMAVGIGSMHYVGMEGMSMSVALVYDPRLFALSIVVAHVLATTALYVKFVLSEGTWARTRSVKLASAVAMGLAVAAMHYTAMAAARFFHDPTAVVVGVVFSPLTLGATICGVTSVIMGVAIIGTVVDRHFEEAADRLAKSEAWADAVLDTAADGILSTDERGTILSFNEAAARMFGYLPAGMTGLSVTTLVMPPSRDADDAPPPWQPAGTSGSAPVYRDLIGRRRDGTAFPLELAVSELHRGEGRVYIGSMRDVTERKALEGQLAQAQKLESIGQLAAGIAHEINTPVQFVGDNIRFLRTAFGDLHALLEGYGRLHCAVAGGAPDGDLVEEVTRLQKAADVPYLLEEIPTASRQALEGVERVTSIVRALREFAHPDGTERVAVDLNRALESTLTVARNEVKYVADVETDFAELPPLVCHPGELNQVFLNIVVNAAHAIADVVGPTGGRGTISIRTAAEDDFLVVSIRDTGAGIPEAIRARIFDPFFTTKTVGRGTGQGLAIARSVVQKHGGSLRFETETGRGTTFFVRLPVRGWPAGAAA